MRVALAMLAVVAVSGAATSSAAAPSRPRAATPSYLELARTAVADARKTWWNPSTNWYEETRSGRATRPTATLWTMYPLFEAYDWIRLAAPTKAARADVLAFAARAAEYWNPTRKGFAYTLESARNPNAQLYFDDNGWWGIAFLDAYRATGSRTALANAKRALAFVIDRGWTKNGTLWRMGSTRTTAEPLAAAAYLSASLYHLEHRPVWESQALRLIDWADRHSYDAKRGVYVRNATDRTALDYVQGMMIGAQLELCRATGDKSHCARALQLGRAGQREFPDPLAWAPAPDGIYLRFLLDLFTQTHDRTFSDQAVATAQRALARRDVTGLFSHNWSGADGSEPPLRNQGATAALFAQLAALQG
jgi:uncharacterized protein YyaL (SSP411 family)